MDSDDPRFWEERPLEPLHLGTQIVATFAIPDGLGNAKLQRATVTIDRLDGDAWVEALGQLYQARAGLAGRESPDRPPPEKQANPPGEIDRALVQAGVKAVGPGAPGA